ncbi:hypothetical protein LSTR_LSTR006339 [Laodelphax striatellus]|uniref:Uncharacterized protein n=1 Tax=Laodelphax striatellus TaxID=195883 RepID=A0A482XE96_LAOST|nr:hypothetical protein LSTR_LSTR006339 [Laodelphax striatellus]
MSDRRGFVGRASMFLGSLRGCCLGKSVRVILGTGKHKTRTSRPGRSLTRLAAETCAPGTPCRQAARQQLEAQINRPATPASTPDPASSTSFFDPSFYLLFCSACTCANRACKNSRLVFCHTVKKRDFSPHTDEASNPCSLFPRPRTQWVFGKSGDVKSTHREGDVVLIRAFCPKRRFSLLSCTGNAEQFVLKNCHWSSERNQMENRVKQAGIWRYPTWHDCLHYNVLCQIEWTTAERSASR